MVQAKKIAGYPAKADGTKSRKRPPGPRKGIWGATLVRYLLDPLASTQRLAKKYGDISFMKFGSQDVYFLSHPDYIKEVLVTRQESFMKGLALQRSKALLGEGLLTSEGDEHLRQRRLAQPAFHRQRIAAYGEVMVEYGRRTRERWVDGETLDISQEMMRLTLGIVGQTLFGSDVESEAREVGEAMTVVMNLFKTLVLPFHALLQKLPLPQNRRLKEAKARLDTIIYRMIEERRRSGEERGDLLSMLLNARDEEGDHRGMSDKQLRDELITIFLAGHETTANALTWTWYLLSQHPDVEARLHAELDEVLGRRLPSASDLPNLVYTEMVFAESMRLYPPAWALGRMTTEEVEIAGYQIPAGTLVLMSQFVTHRDPRYFPDPLRFDPQRWTTENREARPQFSYFPFGGGTRRCIGESFAWMEGILLVATLAQQWSMRLVPGHPVKLLPVMTLRPKHGMRMVVTDRTKTSSQVATGISS
jgi:cytochrome P450